MVRQVLMDAAHPSICAFPSGEGGPRSGG
jgi:hypothetical protein